jgi:oligopeptide transport system ATP-binding protein
MNALPLLSVRDLTVHFQVLRSAFRRAHGPVVRAVDDVSFDLQSGEALGIVGESGCGKSTLGRAILQLVPEAKGGIRWMGQDLGALPARDMRDLRRRMQMVFQDPLASLDPRLTVERIIGLPLRTFCPERSREAVRQRVQEVMGEVGLPASAARRYPHQFSGGQCQRIGIARALIIRPSLVVCDEPTSALDISVQAQILNLILRLRREYRLSLLFISHNLEVVRHICDRVMVLYLGKVVEMGTREAVFAAPSHPYTQMLLAAAPKIGSGIRARDRALESFGEPGSAINPPSGCRFRTRCPKATGLCSRIEPPLVTTEDGRQVACHYAA